MRSSRALLVLAVGLGMAAPAAVQADDGALPAPSHATEHALGDTLHAERYQFCHDPKYPLTEPEVRWCALLPPPADTRAARCPAFARSCQAGATARLVPPQKPIELKLPDFGGLGRLVFYTLIAGTVAMLLYLVGRSLVGRRKLVVPTDGDDGVRVQPSSAQAAHAAAIERDVNRLLARARAAAAAGDYLAAVGDLHAALLRRLEGDGHIRIHRSATNGDYVRELRTRAPALAVPVGDVTGAVESIQFGVAAPASLYQALLERVTALLEVSARDTAVVLIALALTVASCNTNVRSDWRDSPSGSAAVSAFLSASGIETRERLRPLAELGTAKGGASPENKIEASKDDEDGEMSRKEEGGVSKLARPPQQIVILPDATVGDADWQAVKAVLDRSELTLVVAGPRKLPAWIPVELVEGGTTGPVHVTPQLQRWRNPLLESAGDEIPGKAARENEHVELRLKAIIPAGGWVNVGKPSAHQVLLRRGGKPYAVAIEIGEGGHGRVIVLADGDLFTNASLAVADNAAVLHILMSGAGGPVQVVTEETGLVATTPLESVSRGRLAPFMAQLCAFLLLFYLLKGAAFGKLMDRQVVRRRRFSEHVEALGLQYARARAARHAATAYAVWTVERLREKIRLPGARGLGDLAAATAARTGQPLGEVARLLFQSHPDEGADNEPRTRATAEEPLQTIRALATLLASASGRATTTRATTTRETKS